MHASECLFFTLSSHLVISWFKIVGPIFPVMLCSGVIVSLYILFVDLEYIVDFLSHLIFHN